MERHGPKWPCFVMLCECRVDSCFFKLLYMVVSLLFSLAFSLTTHCWINSCWMNEWLTHQGLTVLFCAVQQRGRERRQSSPGIMHWAPTRHWENTCHELVEGPLLFPSESSLVACSVSLHHWQLWLCHPKETKLERMSQSVQVMLFVWRF